MEELRIILSNKLHQLNLKQEHLLGELETRGPRWPLYRSPNWLKAVLVILVEKHPRIIPIKF